MDTNYENIKILDEHNFDRFVLEYSSVFVSFAKRYMGNIQEAEDIVQDALCNLWDNRHKLKDISSPINYTFTIIKNLSINKLKINKRVTYYSEINPELYGEKDFFNDLVAIDSSLQLFNAINHLPPQSRNIMLQYMKGLKGDEIAKELGISVSSVKTLKTSSIKKLEKLLPDKLLLIIAVW